MINVVFKLLQLSRKLNRPSIRVAWFINNIFSLKLQTWAELAQLKVGNCNRVLSQSFSCHLLYTGVVHGRQFARSSYRCCHRRGAVPLPTQVTNGL